MVVFFVSAYQGGFLKLGGPLLFPRKRPRLGRAGHVGIGGLVADASTLLGEALEPPVFVVPTFVLFLLLIDVSTYKIKEFVCFFSCVSIVWGVNLFCTKRSTIIVWSCC